MHKTNAIPQRLLDKALTEEDKQRLQDEFGHQPMTTQEIEQRKLDELRDAERREEEKKTQYLRDRRDAFREIPQGDQNDELWRAISVLFDQAGIAPPETVATMLQRRANIKAENPKPETEKR